MDPIVWLAFFIFMALSYCQIAVFYIHEYGVKDGWTNIMEGFSEKVKIIALPGAILIIYFIIEYGIRGIAMFLAWKLIYESSGIASDDDPEDDLDVICAMFFVSIVVGIFWSKSFFNPPTPFFLSCFIAALIETAAVGVSLNYYLDIDQHNFGDPGSKHAAPFVLQTIYFCTYSVILLIASFYCLFNSEDIFVELGIGDDKWNTKQTRK